MFDEIKTGVDNLIKKPGDRPLGGSPGILCHEASVTSQLVHSIDALIACGVNLSAIFGPQHGIYGTDQANMVEWQSSVDSHTGLPLYSLYGENRKPTSDMLSGLSSMIIDLQDVGARYYTYIWTALLTLRACAEADIPVIVCDRPNPIGGQNIEGCGIDEGYESFVGLTNIPICHGLTIGELLSLLASEEGIAKNLYISEMSGWNREMRWPATGLQWINPSPNMPGYRSALVYPGGCLVEGTNLSEGRGTTCPFELIGAPWVDARDFTAALDAENIPGVAFRPTEFKPAFDKFVGQTCRGIQVHVIDEESFRPVLTYYAIIKCARALYPEDFAWAQPPYEYEFEKLPIDILAGSPTFRESVEEDIPSREIAETWRDNELSFDSERRNYLLY